MDAFVAAALLGTAQYPNREISTGTPVDTLVEQLPEGERERQLLLAAGARAIYHQAGQVAETIPALPEPALPEKLPVCSQSIVVLLEKMFRGEHADLLQDLLERMQSAGVRIPHELLPAALNMQAKEIRAVLYPVLGERGLWLSQFNSAWSWVKNFLPMTEATVPSDAEAIWQEGTPGQRKSILQLLRTTDPAKARKWLTAAWKQEKAENRAEFLATFAVGLSAEDEPLLEKALDDRAASVRAIPPGLLARIPTSAFAIRMRTRADTMLTYADGKLTIKPPTAIDKLWERDGIVAKSPSSAIGERAWWMLQVMACIPPAYWEQQFGATPNELITAANTNKWGNSLIEGWSEGAQRHHETYWIEPLWDWWHQQQGNKKSSGLTTTDMRQTLIILLPAQDAERKVQQLFVNSGLSGNADWEEQLEELPKPWSTEFGERYLLELRNYIETLKPGTRSYPYNDSWYQSISIAARALPPSCFAAALKPWTLPDNQNWQIAQWQQELDSCMETLRLRQRLLEETTKNE